MFMNMGQAAQGQNPLQQQMQQGYGTLPLGQQQDPRSAYLQQALQSMQGGGQQQGNAMGLTSNLLAEALDRYGLSQRQNQLARQAQGQQLGSDFAALNAKNSAFAGGLGD